MAEQFSQKREAVEKKYICSDHAPIRMTFEVPHIKNNSSVETFKGFRKTNIYETCKMMRTKLYNLICHTNINQMSEEINQFFEDIINLNAPRRTPHNQSLPPWITASTSYEKTTNPTITT